MDFQMHRARKQVVVEAQLDRLHAKVFCTVTNGDFGRGDIRVELIAGGIPSWSSESAMCEAFAEHVLNNKEKIRRELLGGEQF